MQYKVTQQYARAEEKPLAEFNNLDDVGLFIEAKLAFDEMQNMKLIYRIFDAGKLLKEFNKEKINVPLNRAKYAEGDSDLPEPFANPFKVATKNRNDDKVEIAIFCNIDDARIFIKEKLQIDAVNKIDRIYFIFNLNKFVEKIDQAMLDIQKSQSQGSQGKQKTVSFRPTPFATTLRLGPPKWVVDEEDNEKNKNK